MRIGPRVWGVGKLLVLVGALGATFLLFFGISLRVALRAQEVDVPDLVGRAVPDASQALLGVGLGLQIDDSEHPDETVPSGRVMRQDPAPGTTARRARTVRVWISSGPRAVTVPALGGESERTATIRVRQNGLDLAPLAEFRSPDYATDTVVSQYPVPESRGQRVSLLVNRADAPASYLMPDLTGMDGTAARQAFEGRGFRVALYPVPAVAGVAPGAVARQRPPAGTRIGPADPISFEVSR